MKCQISVKSNVKICALCKYWNDPANSALTLKDPIIGLWEYEREAKNYCTKGVYKSLRPAYSMACSEYECKISR